MKNQLSSCTIFWILVIMGNIGSNSCATLGIASTKNSGCPNWNLYTWNYNTCNVKGKPGKIKKKN